MIADEHPTLLQCLKAGAAAFDASLKASLGKAELTSAPPHGGPRGSLESSLDPRGRHLAHLAKLAADGDRMAKAQLIDLTTYGPSGRIIAKTDDRATRLGTVIQRLRTLLQNLKENTNE
jgi:hypothetical protein